MGKNRKKKNRGSSHREKKRWRKLDVDKLVGKTVPKTEADRVAAREAEVAMLTNNKLWTEDLKPRDRRAKKVIRREKARRRLARIGITTNDLITPESRLKSQSKPLSNRKVMSKRGFASKSRFDPSANVYKEHVPKPMNAKPFKFSPNHKGSRPKIETIEFEGSSTKIVKVPQKSVKHVYKRPNRDLHTATHWRRRNKNIRGKGQSGIKCAQSAMQKGRRTKHLKVKDPWASEDKNFKKLNKRKKQKTASQLIRKMERISGVRSKNTFQPKSVKKNPCIPKVAAISLPREGDSINPQLHNFYFQKYKALRSEILKRYRKYYPGAKDTESFWTEFATIEVNGKKINIKGRAGKDKKFKLNIEKLEKHAEEMRQLWKKHLTAYNKGLTAASQKARAKGEKFWVAPEDRDVDPKYASVKWKGEEAVNKGKTMWGPDYRYRFRSRNTFTADKLGQPLRKIVNTGVDHPASFLFHELQKHHRIPGEKLVKTVRAPQKPMLAPRFKTSTWIGKIDHRHVGDPLFADVDPVWEDRL